MIDHHGTWLLSVKLGLPVIAFVAFIMIIILVVMVMSATHNGDRDFLVLLGWFPLLVLLAVLIVPLFAYYPYHGDYHRLQPVTGTVTAVDSRYLRASQYLVVTFDGGLSVRCDDSRCATVKIGDNLRLLCTKEHQWGSPLDIDGWGCRWGE